MDKGKLNNDGHNACSVQVVFVEYSSKATYVLWGKGEFLTVPAMVSITDVTPEMIEHESQ